MSEVQTKFESGTAETSITQTRKHPQSEPIYAIMAAQNPDLGGGDASDWFLFPKLFPFISENEREKVICGTPVCQQIHALCLPSLTTNLVVSARNGFNPATLAAFKKPPPRLRMLRFAAPDLGFDQAVYSQWDVPGLPEILTTVEFIPQGTEAQERYVLRCLERLPRLESLSITLPSKYSDSVRTSYVPVSEFPNLFRRLQRVSADFPDHASWLAGNSSIEYLRLAIPGRPVLTKENEASMRAVLRTLRNLRTVYLSSCPTSFLAGPASVPQIRVLVMSTPRWDLSGDEDETKRVIRGLKDVEIRFANCGYHKLVGQDTIPGSVRVPGRNHVLGIAFFCWRSR